MTLQPTILLLEDSEDTRDLLMKALEMMGFIVVGAANGKDAIKTLESTSIKPDLILTDMNLPHMTGAEFIAAVKSRGLAPDCKIVFLSANPRVREEAAAHGIHGGIRKPVDFDELNSELHSILSR
jgi:CheY-like chemotaxis protein